MGSQRDPAKAAAWKSRIWAIRYRQNNNAPGSDQRPMGAGGEEQTQFLAGFLVALILPIRAYYGALWLIRKGDPLRWQNGLGRTKKVEQWGRMGRVLDDYQGAINDKTPVRIKAKWIHNFIDRQCPPWEPFATAAAGGEPWPN